MHDALFVSEDQFSHMPDVTFLSLRIDRNYVVSGFEKIFRGRIQRICIFQSGHERIHVRISPVHVTRDKRSVCEFAVQGFMENKHRNTDQV